VRREGKQLIRNQRTILLLAIGLILTVSVVIAAASAGARLAPEGSDTTDAPREITPSNLTPGSTGTSVIGSTMEEGGDPLVEKPESPGSFSPSPTSDNNPSPTATAVSSPSPNPTVTSTSVPATSRAPTGNLLANPYFEGDHSSTVIPGWVNNGLWDISVKPHNPSPNNTAARINDPEQQGESQPGETAVIYQIVEGGGSSLAASIACVEHYAEVMQVTIFGSQSPDGPWTSVWQPFDLSACGFADWGPTVYAQTQLPQAWAYYQFQIVGRFVDWRGAVKVTDVSLSLQ